MTACDSTRKRLSAYLDGEVTPVECASIEGHLAGCAGCRTLREELARSTQMLANAPEPHWASDSTDQLVGRLRAQLARERPAPPAHAMAGQVAAARDGFNWRALVLPLAAVVLVVAVPGLWMTGVRRESARNAKAPGAVAADAEKMATARAVAPEPAALAPAPQASLAAVAPAVTANAVAVAAPAAAPAEVPAQLAQGKENSTAAGRAPGGGAAPAKDVLAKAEEPAKMQDAGLAGALARLEPAAPKLASVPARVKADVPTPTVQPASGALSALDIEIAALEARMARVEAEVSAFTTAARGDAHRESSQVASRRFATWR